MNLELKRHKLLQILSKQSSDLELGKAKIKAVGVSFEEIYKELKCDEDELQLITSELYTSDEIGYHDAYNIVGLYIKNKGSASSANKKYKRIYWKRITDLTKNAIQIIIPILSLLIAYVALTIKIKSLNKLTENKIDNLEKQIVELKDKLKENEKDMILKKIDSSVSE